MTSPIAHPRSPENLRVAVPTAPSRVAVVVINYNDRENLRHCLASIPATAEILLVDNASRDGSVTMVASEFPHVTIVADGTNPGYGAAANKGIAATSAEYVFVLNSDTRVDGAGIEALGRYLDEHPDVAVVGPRILNPDRSLQASCFPFPGTLHWLLENDPVGLLAGWVPVLRRTLYRFAPPEHAGPVPWVLGAALAIRRTAFEEVGGFDPSFFLYFEEVDLCARLWARGWKAHFTPDATIVHQGSASTSAVRQWAAVQHFHSNLRYYRRHLRGISLPLWIGIMRTKLVFRLVRDSAAWVLEQSEGRRAMLWEDVGAWRAALRQTGR